MRIILIEDDQITVSLIKHALGPQHYLVNATNRSMAEKLIDEQRWDLALIDLNLESALDGMGLIKQFKAKNIFSVIISAHEDDNIIEECYQNGCDDYYAKGEVVNSISEILKQVKLTRKPGLPDYIFDSRYLTTDLETKKQTNNLLQAIESNTPALVMGETGTGKSELVKVIHEHSQLEGEFVELNCASLPKDLIESELFGFEKGAFTGADKTRMGKIGLAHNGILFLDEIGCLSLETQAKLLKVLEEKKFYPIGSLESKSSNFRLVAATNDDLFVSASKGQFRLDLLQRICGSVIHLKPLRERPDDLWLILKKLSLSSRRLSFSDEAKNELMNYPWPGNVREAKNFLQFCGKRESGRIGITDVKDFLKQFATPPQTVIPHDLVNMALDIGLDSLSERIREHIIKQVLEQNAGHVGKTMQDLKISTRQFYKYNSKEMVTHVQ